MEETQKFFEPTPVNRDAEFVSEPDETLVTPRFDAVEAQVARPVVPLAGGGRSRPVKRRRQLPIALVLISALAGGVVSLLAFRLYQQQSQVVAMETGNQQPTNAAPTPELPASAETSATVTEDQAPTEAPLIFEEFDPVKEGVEIGDAATTRKAEAGAKSAEARRDEPKNEAKPTTTAARAAGTSPRRVESSPAPRQVEARHEDVRRDDSSRANEDIIAERRERQRERREQRREQRRSPKRNIDRIKDIFEGAPPS